MVLPRPCNGCGVVVRAARCDACKRLQERKRPKRADRGYDSKWHELSRTMRALQPFCTICHSTKDLTLDHIKPLSQGGLSIPSNAQVLCRKCNSRKGSQ